MDTSKEKCRDDRWKEGTAMNASVNACAVDLPVSSRFFFSCKARFFAGLFFDVFFSFFFGKQTCLKQLQPV